jgi:hypothetical protein
MTIKDKEAGKIIQAAVRGAYFKLKHAIFTSVSLDTFCIILPVVQPLKIF